MPFQIIRADITTVKADVIVNSASQMPLIGRGSDWAIYDAADRTRLYLARKQLGEIAPGEVGVTPAFRLKAKYIFHTVAPFWEGGSAGEEETLRSCYRNCLEKATEIKAESIAFPLLSTGSCGIPKELGLSIALSEIGSFLLKHDMLVYLVVFDRTSFALSLQLQKDVQQYIDDHMAAALHQKEHAAFDADMPSSAKQQYNVPSAARPPLPSASSQSRPRKEYAVPDALPKAKGKRRRGLPDIGSLLPSGKPSSSSLLRPEKKTDEELGDGFSLPDSFPDSLSDYGSFGPSGFFGEEASKDSADFREEMPVSAASIPSPSLDEMLRHPGESFHSMLFRLIDERELTNAQVYKKANLDRKLFSKIQCSEDYIPRKKTILALAIALRLNLDETTDLLSRAGLSLSPGIKSDLIVQYCIEHEIYNIFEVDALLFQYDQPLLGA